MYLILGLGISNLAVVNKLKELNKKMIIAVNEDEKVNAKETGISVIGFSEIQFLNLNKIKYVIKSPGIPYHNKYVKYLRKNNVKILNEIELTYYLSNKKGFYIGVTGSVGKSSVVSLLYELIKSKYQNVILAGNIGVPLITCLDKIDKDTIIILEVSSFQLDDFIDIRFNIALLLNIYDNHLDFYLNKTHYYKSKLRIANNQKEKDYFISDFNNQIIKRYYNGNSKTIDYKKRFHVYYDCLYYDLKKIVSLNDYNLIGKDNLYNLMSVLTILRILKIDLDIASLKSFKPLKYHLEKYEINNITFVNDSKSTCTSSLKSAIRSFNNDKLILLFGGYNKNLDFEFLKNYNFKKLICFGGLTNQIENINCTKFIHLKDALSFVLEISKPDDIVLFSPGCASFDEFSGYIQRGKYFEDTIRDYYGK